MMPSITVCTFLTVTNGFSDVRPELALTNGAPSNSSELLALNIYRTFYGRAGFEGVGQAKAVVFFHHRGRDCSLSRTVTTSKGGPSMSDKVKGILYSDGFPSIASLAWVYPIVLEVINSFAAGVYISRNILRPPGKVSGPNYIRGIEHEPTSSFGWTVNVTVGASC